MVIRSVLVVGAGSAGLISAIALKTQVPDLEVKLIHSPAVP